MGALLRHRFAVLVIFGAFSFGAVALGAYICVAMGAPSALWVRNLAAWGVGAIVAIAVALTFRPVMLHVALWAAPLGLLATFANSAQAGVHRWIDIGPLHANAAMLLLPPMIVAVAMLTRQNVWSWVAPFAALLLVVLQPDASQATALAIVLIGLALGASLQPIARFAIIVAIAALATLAWFQPDPLQPVPEVEDILSAGFMTVPIATGFALIFLISTALCADAPWRSRPTPQRLAAWALSAFFLGWIGTTFLGAFPVPWVGVGLSPIIGAWLGIGLLAGLPRSPAKA